MINFITPSKVIENGNTNELAIDRFVLMYKENPESLDNDNWFKIFLAGTIDNGEADDWQKELFLNLYFQLEPMSITYGENYVTPPGKYDLNIYSPKRDDWKNDATNEEIEEQIRWEQDKLDKADLIVMVIQDNSKSPISLLELGLYGPTGKLICFCTEIFYRYTNVKLTCDKWMIPLYNTTDKWEISEKIIGILKEIKEN